MNGSPTSAPCRDHVVACTAGHAAEFTPTDCDRILIQQRLRGKHHLATLVALAPSQPDITSSRAQMGPRLQQVLNTYRLEPRPLLQSTEIKQACICTDSLEVVLPLRVNSWK
ncbi:hypothetical protein D4764_21G0003640 [Takifugu flavidus]|uniref:Uncharacterized protein n=1 Tax=Takifugu flavidus TaxID=433684 RepID=A0A5C6ND91_9TELE|nr:hypothetical protein D4764_21G0003640 [Takifugu flavidus]